MKAIRNLRTLTLKQMLIMSLFFSIFITINTSASEQDISDDEPFQRIASGELVELTSLEKTLYGKAAFEDENTVCLTQNKTWVQGMLSIDNYIETLNDTFVEMDVYLGDGKRGRGADGICVSFTPTINQRMGPGGALGYSETGVAIGLKTFAEHEPQQIMVFEGTIRSSFSYYPSSYLDDNNWHNLKIYYHDTSFTVYWDNKKVLYYDDVDVVENGYLSVRGTTGTYYNHQAIKNLKVYVNKDNIPTQDDAQQTVSFEYKGKKYITQIPKKFEEVIISFCTGSPHYGGYNCFWINAIDRKNVDRAICRYSNSSWYNEGFHFVTFHNSNGDILPDEHRYFSEDEGKTWTLRDVGEDGLVRQRDTEFLYSTVDIYDGSGNLIFEANTPSNTDIVKVPDEENLLTYNKVRADILSDTNKLPYSTLSKFYSEYNPSSEILLGMKSVDAFFTEFWDNDMGYKIIKDTHSVARYDLTKSDIYYALILKLFKDNSKKNAMEIIDECVTNAETLQKNIKGIIGTGKTYYSIQELTPEQRNAIETLLSNNLKGILKKNASANYTDAFLSLTDNVSSYIEDVVSVSGYVSDSLTMLNNTITLCLMGELEHDLLTNMKNLSSMGSPYLNDALTKAVNGFNMPINSLLHYDGQLAVQALSDWCFGLTTDALKSTNPAVSAAFRAFDTGLFLEKILVNTDSITATLYNCAAISEITDLIWYLYQHSVNEYKKERTEYNARMVIHSYELYYKSCLLNIEMAKKYIDAVLDSRVYKTPSFLAWNGIREFFTGDNYLEGKRAAMEMIDYQEEYLNNAKKRIDLFVKADVLQNYPDLYPNNTSVSLNRDVKYEYVFACPIELLIETSNGISTISNTMSLMDDSLILNMDEDTKHVLTYNEGFTIKIKGTGEGTMDCYIYEYVGDNKTLISTYSDVPITTNSIYTISTTSTATLQNVYNVLLDNNNQEMHHNKSTAVNLSVEGGFIERHSLSAVSNCDYLPGDTATISAIVPAGSRFVRWESNGFNDYIKDKLSPVTKIIIPDEDIAIRAIVQQVEKTYTVKASCSDGGRISNAGTITVTEGDDFTLFFMPYDGFEVSNVIIDSTTLVNQTHYTLDNIRNNHTIFVQFQALDFGDAKNDAILEKSNDIDTENNGNNSKKNNDDECKNSGAATTKDGKTNNETNEKEENIEPGSSNDTISKRNTLFEDVTNPSVYYYIPVYWAVDKSITTGTGNNHFSPYAHCTRGQIIAFIWRMMDCPTPTRTDYSFKDLDGNGYFSIPAVWAWSKGITTGKSKNTFAPNDDCTRAEMVTFLWRAAGSPEPKSKNTFVDINFNNYYYKAVLWAYEYNITKGTGSDLFSPDLTCTRAQAVTFLYRFAQIK